MKQPSAEGLLLWARQAGDIDPALSSSAARPANAGSATLSAYVAS